MICLPFPNDSSDQVMFDLSHVIRNGSSPVQNGSDSIYAMFVDQASGSGAIQYNLLAEILSIQLESIEADVNFQLEVQSSILAPSPPVASTDQLSKAITVATSSIQASQVCSFF